ncbi:MAG TPA: 2-phosphosulfolactate phosphatase [Gemmatimonadaceae bacterium]|nr:2-phosphosulfolactate phosphatase [Gemmatimonadaceae bacterium]
MWFDQSGFDLRCEWGERAAEILSPLVDAVILVDVLSFTTCVDIATSRGAFVFPYRWKDATSIAFARDVDAILAGPRDATRISLSPASLLHVMPDTRIVLPSPNGATLSLLTGSTPAFAGCLRNAEAVAHAAQAVGPKIAVIPAGERWPDGSLRPCLEDWLGAGAILRYLSGSASPEAEAARLAYGQHEHRLAETVRECASGRELIEQGWARDVALASEIGVSRAAPRLTGGAYRSMNPIRRGYTAPSSAARRRARCRIATSSCEFPDA